VPDAEARAKAAHLYEGYCTDDNLAVRRGTVARVVPPQDLAHPSPEPAAVQHLRRAGASPSPWSAAATAAYGAEPVRKADAAGDAVTAGVPIVIPRATSCGLGDGPCQFHFDRTVKRYRYSRRVVLQLPLPREFDVQALVFPKRCPGALFLMLFPDVAERELLVQVLSLYNLIAFVAVCRCTVGLFAATCRIFLIVLIWLVAS
jgi:hypothetical protein